MEKQRHNALITGVTLAVVAVGLYAFIVLKFMVH